MPQRTFYDDQMNCLRSRKSAAEDERVFMAFAWTKAKADCNYIEFQCTWHDEMLRIDVIKFITLTKENCLFHMLNIFIKSSFFYSKWIQYIPTEVYIFHSKNCGFCGRKCHISSCCSYFLFVFNHLQTRVTNWTAKPVGENESVQSKHKRDLLDLEQQFYRRIWIRFYGLNQEGSKGTSG